MANASVGNPDPLFRKQSTQFKREPHGGYQTADADNAEPKPLEQARGRIKARRDYPKDKQRGTRSKHASGRNINKDQASIPWNVTIAPLNKQGPVRITCDMKTIRKWVC